MNVQVAHEGEYRRVIVDVVQVIQDDVQAPSGVARTQSSEGFADIDHALVLEEQPFEAVVVHVVKPRNCSVPCKRR